MRINEKEISIGCIYDLKSRHPIILSVLKGVGMF